MWAPASPGAGLETRSVLEGMGTRIIQFGAVPGDILSALTGNGYHVDACGASIAKLEQALQRQDDPDAIAVAENGASEAAGILATVRSSGTVPLILFQDESRTCDPSEFDLVIPEHAPLKDLLERVETLIARSHAIHAESRLQSGQFHFLLRETVSLHQDCVAVGVESQHIRAKLQGPVTERVSIPCVLVVDDHARWRETMCSMLQHYADCRLLYETGDGIEAVKLAAERKPRLILLDLNMPRLNGIQAAREIAQLSPDSAILFVSMNNSVDVVSEALRTGALGYVLKTDAGRDLWPAVEAILQNKQFLSCSLRGAHSVKIQ